jgi:hypothetical protein
VEFERAEVKLTGRRRNFSSPLFILQTRLPANEEKKYLLPPFADATAGERILIDTDSVIKFFASMVESVASMKRSFDLKAESVF